MAKGQSLQDPFLNALRRERVPVSIYLVNGIKLQGQVESFDQFVILLKIQSARWFISTPSLLLCLLVRFRITAILRAVAPIIIMVVIRLRRNSRSRTVMTLNKAHCWSTMMENISNGFKLMFSALAALIRLRGCTFV